jgi:subtilisin family serine protease
MKEKIVGIAICMLMIATAVPALGIVENNKKIVSAPPESNTDFVPGEFIVKFKPDIAIEPLVSPEGIFTTGVASIDALNEKYHVFNGERVFGSFTHLMRDHHDLNNVFNFHAPENANIDAIIQDYSSDPHVSYVEPNYLMHSCVIPNDPSFDLQYALHNTGQTGGTPDADIDAPEAWDIETGDHNIVIAIHDTGVDWDHPDLAENIWVNPGEDLNQNGEVDPSDFNGIDDDSNGFIDDLRGWDFVDTNATGWPGEDRTERDNNPMDFLGHGTHCSGIASAVTNNNVGIAGVCWNCSIMPVRVGYVNDIGYGWQEMDDAVAGIVYAAENGADVLSMSWGLYAGYFEPQLLEDAINYAYGQGVILVAAAGNEAVSYKLYPAAYDTVIAVAATDNTDTKASWSCYGSWVDVAAPGVDILSTLFNDTYDTWSGTSMSTPLVAGIIGLMLSHTPGLNQAEVRTILRSTTDPVQSNLYIGTGRVNAYTALQRTSAPLTEFNSTLGDSHVSGEISINGSAGGSTFTEYEVMYGKGAYPSGWTEITSSTTPVIDGVLAVLDTTPLDEDEIYSIRLVVHDTNGFESVDQLIVVIDNEPAEPTGYEIQWSVPFGSQRPHQTVPIGDIDEDGINEIIVGLWDVINAGVFQIISYDETEKTYITEHSWVVLPDLYSGTARWPCGACVIDLDDDGDLEFCVSWVLSAADGVYALDWDGSTLTELDVYNGTGFDNVYSLYPCDYDDDGDTELLLANAPFEGTGDKHLTALSWDNNHNSFVEEAFWTLEGQTDKECWGLNCGDTDDDGKTEVIVTLVRAATTAGTWALNWNSETSEWEQEPVCTNYSGAVPAGAFVGDLNGNGIPEIGVGSGNRPTAWLYEWNGSGYEEVWSQTYSGEDIVHYGVEIGDADNDGINEFLVGTDNVHVLQWKETEYIEEAVLTDPLNNVKSVNVGDCDSDGENELSVSGGTGSIGSHYIYQYIGLPPHADFNWTPQNPGPNQPITFDASASLDPDGTITLYEWDWDNDGIYDEAHTSPVATHTWVNLGCYQVRLQVTDDQNFTGTIIKTVNVSGAVNFTLDITGGFGIKAAIKNNGTLNATSIQWKFTLTGGFILLGKTKNGTIPSLAIGASTTVKDAPILGFGKTTIQLEVTCAEGASATQTATGFVFLFFVLGVKGS